MDFSRLGSRAPAKSSADSSRNRVSPQIVCTHVGKESGPSSNLGEFLDEGGFVLLGEVPTGIDPPGLLGIQVHGQVLDSPSTSSFTDPNPSPIPTLVRSPLEP